MEEDIIKARIYRNRIDFEIFFDKYIKNIEIDYEHLVTDTSSIDHSYSMDITDYYVKSKLNVFGEEYDEVINYRVSMRDHYYYVGRNLSIYFIYEGYCIFVALSPFTDFNDGKYTNWSRILIYDSLKNDTNEEISLSKYKNLIGQRYNPIEPVFDHEFQMEFNYNNNVIEEAIKIVKREFIGKSRNKTEK